jgi:hypothetical protein
VLFRKLGNKLGKVGKDRKYGKDGKLGKLRIMLPLGKVILAPRESREVREFPRELGKEGKFPARAQKGMNSGTLRGLFPPMEGTLGKSGKYSGNKLGKLGKDGNALGKLGKPQGKAEDTSYLLHISS